MLGPEDPQLLLDPLLPGGRGVLPDLLPCGCRMFGGGRGGQHDPGVEHSEQPEQVRHPDLLARRQVQSDCGKEISGRRGSMLGGSIGAQTFEGL